MSIAQYFEQAQELFESKAEDVEQEAEDSKREGGFEYNDPGYWEAKAAHDRLKAYKHLRRSFDVLAGKYASRQYAALKEGLDTLAKELREAHFRTEASLVDRASAALHRKNLVSASPLCLSCGLKKVSLSDLGQAHAQAQE